MVIVFDILGTLLNTQVLDSVVRQATDGKVSATRYTKEVTSYAMATSLAGRFEPYEVIAGSVLQMEAAAHGVKLGEKELAKLKRRLYSLPAFPEVKGALKQLHARGLRLAALSNGSAAMLEALLAGSKLKGYFEQVISVETVQKYKPAREVYEAALEQLGGGAHELVLVAAHPWDLLGATHAGYRTALIQRGRTAPYPGVSAPNFTARDVQDFANQLLGITDERGGSGRGWLLGGCGIALGVAGALAAVSGSESKNKLNFPKSEQFSVAE